MIEKKISNRSEDKAILVGLIQREQTEKLVTEYMEELKFLAETAGARAVKSFTQKLSHPDSKTFIGKGKLGEIKNYISGKNIELIIFDDELRGSQIRISKKS